MDHLPKVMGFLFVLEILLEFFVAHVAEITDLDLLLYRIVVERHKNPPS
jgi:hypothetical protein